MVVTNVTCQGDNLAELWVNFLLVESERSETDKQFLQLKETRSPSVPLSPRELMETAHAMVKNHP